ncbi:histidine triad nucleotide-binding protein [Candidatus Giovannonibacteria bacterium RIFCSPHIGHO2_02_FULL_46_20]|uniref:Histidine triad nucleotide-binding protein n=1 Tax=Candidatus Giovannonibacteria bacterium RIFCSPHIGHO2_02_FULL_46_20 TaxID=1798338 RepID=A0A1F5WGR8_9BACT|nr:MAG: histidine triad nucleotide-binding protein [Candidatus Giovannonibacteria bacterium RIFCSPHIGHO2_02_FULL_46_20]
MDCIFCKIIHKEVPAEVLRETQDVVMIPDIRPSAPIHYLIISKRHIASIRDVDHNDEKLLGHMVHAAKEGAEQLGLSGYKLVFNVGKDGGQIVDHIHLHLLGGWERGEQKKIN